MKKTRGAARQPLYRSTTLRVVPRRPLRRQDIHGQGSASFSASQSDIRPNTVHSSKPHESTSTTTVAGTLLAKQKPSLDNRKFATEEPPRQTEVAQKKKKSKKRHGKKLAMQLYVLAGSVLAIGGVLAYQAYHTNTLVEKQVVQLKEQVAISTDNGSSGLPPNEEKPKDSNYIQNYRVAPLVPRTITIKKIGVYARILQVGTDAQGRMDVPKTAYDTAWYTGSSRPGEQGAMIVDAHVMSIGGSAVFSNLKDLAVGDVINVVRGDGKEFTYTVARTEQVPVDKVDMGKLLMSHNPSVPGLNLITCAGKYDAEAATFDDRTIVYAVQT